MHQPIDRHVLDVVSPDAARARLQMHLPADARVGVYWLPALGVGIGPNERLADALGARGVAVAIHEWRGLGGSDRRAARRCDWGYRELLDFDIAAGLAAARRHAPALRWILGGHSLGGQFALIEAARASVAIDGAPSDGVFLVASGQPHWRAFPGWKAAGVLAFASAIPAITAVVGYFPGSRLGFAGREARRLMCEWAGTAVRGDYGIPAAGGDYDRALANFAGPVLAIRMSEDRLAPPGALDRLRALAPRAQWQVRDFGRGQFATRRPDHFGWLREPEAVAAAFEAWCSQHVPARHAEGATAPRATLAP
jgi:predicted alpha/beta hydrolase